MILKNKLTKEKLDIPYSEFKKKFSNELLKMMYSSNIIYRSVGILLEDFIKEDEEQLSIFDNVEHKSKSERLGKAIDRLEQRFGRNIVRTGFTNEFVPVKQGFLATPKLTY